MGVLPRHRLVVRCTHDVEHVPALSPALRQRHALRQVTRKPYDVGADPSTSMADSSAFGADSLFPSRGVVRTLDKLGASEMVKRSVAVAARSAFLSAARLARLYERRERSGAQWR